MTSTRSALDRAHHVREQQRRRLVRPVQVLQHQHDRPRLRRVREQRAGRLEQAVPLALRVAADRLGEIRQPARELGNESGELAAVRADLAAQHLRRQRRDVPAERLDERLIGDQQLLVTAAEQHRRALLVCGVSELARQPRLADPRIAGDHREPSRPTPSVGPPGPQPPKRVLATDERAAPPPRQRRGKRRQRFGATDAASVPGPRWPRAGGGSLSRAARAAPPAGGARGRRTPRARRRSPPLRSGAG